MACHVQRVERTTQIESAPVNVEKRTTQVKSAPVNVERRSLKVESAPVNVERRALKVKSAPTRGFFDFTLRALPFSAPNEGDFRRRFGASKVSISRSKKTLDLTPTD